MQNIPSRGEQQMTLRGQNKLIRTVTTTIPHHICRFPHCCHRARFSAMKINNLYKISLRSTTLILFMIYSRAVVAAADQAKAPRKNDDSTMEEKEAIMSVLY